MKINRFNERLNQNIPEVGDYIICKIDYNKTEEDLNKFISQSIGKMIKITPRAYIIYYENLPMNLDIYASDKDGGGIAFEISEIKYWSKDKEELEIILTTNKFNI